MATSPSNPPRKKTVTVPPKRGLIKDQIFESLTGTVSYIVSKAGEALAQIRRRGGGGGGASDSSTSTSTSTAPSPPPSAYTSDGYGDQA